MTGDQTMHSNTGAENGITPSQTIRPRKPPLTLASSRHFRLDAFDLDESDKLLLWAAFLESSALCWRLSRGRLTQARPLSQIANLTPPTSKRPLYDLSDQDLADLVVRLREDAERVRCEAQRDDSISK